MPTCFDMSYPTVKLLLLFLSALTLTSSLPIDSLGFSARRDEPPFAVSKGGIYYCTGVAWSGSCRWQYIYPEHRNGQECVWLHLNDGGIMSIGPDWGIEVEIFLNKECSGAAVTAPMSCPGMGNMAAFGGQGFNVKSQDTWVRVTDVSPERQADPKQQAEDRLNKCPNGPYSDKKYTWKPGPW